ncbi:alpha/beta fold hydrolase [Mucilaginibacter sp. SMC90]|uniref:alpha/beta fold hydrolase n=1 Tax=Mucilaginibacter sp. SMC90 TaxID=2929803 RepID=UPI001FB21BC0|nr:alpha/beta fold hydrolase [Mucilaginibacter sp. SMC90]UOE49097.1 alpha/beta fold hydrolase [Mucilaginibacter sp. SMC90]
MKKVILILLAVATATIMFSSCSKKNDEVKPAAKNYVLVHGAWQAPYVWDAVKAKLINEGNNVTVVELPGHGSDNTVPSTITLNTYRDKVVDAVSKINGKVILVGHSLGGMVISAVAEQEPSKIEKLVYLAAYLPTSGQSLFALASTDPGSSLGGEVNGQKILTENDTNGTLDVARDQIVNIFIQDGSTQVQNLVLQNYRPEPAIPFMNPVTLTAANFGSVEKVYIKTLQDHVVSPGLQDRMIASGNVKTIYKLNTSHSAFLAKPDSVAILLTKIGQ